VFAIRVVGVAEIVIDGDGLDDPGDGRQRCRAPLACRTKARSGPEGELTETVPDHPTH
jgi:hypothetical protein